jgi:hypothetical protein
MKLTIGMATYEDFDGVFFTVQSLRMHQGLSPDDEIIVVDNSPGTAQGNAVKNFCESTGVRYIPMQGASGTTQTRERVFREATGDIVLCMDCHVLLASQAIARLKQWYRQHPDTMDLYQGPMILDQLNWSYTHFDLRWRDQMWGIWGTAWKCEHGYFTVHEKDGKAGYFILNPEMTPVPEEWGLPKLDYFGSVQELLARGYKLAAGSPDDEPFEIPAQGLGLFTCRKEAWLGFNEHFRAFGGEEGYIHEKYRKHGHKTMCLPFLVWNHRFARPNGVRYTLTQEDKIRNYVLGFLELGRDLEEIRSHFASQGMKPGVWERVVADPVNFTVNSAVLTSASGRPVLQPQPTNTYSLEEVYRWVSQQPRDLNEHMPTLRALAEKCEYVAEMTKRRESTVALLAAKPKKLISYQEENDAILDVLERLKDGNTEFSMVVSSLNDIPIPSQEVDLLFIDTRHNANRAMKELAIWREHVRKYIIFHDTESNGFTGDDGQGGLYSAIRPLIEEGVWFISHHNKNQYGLTVLAKNPEDRPKEAIWLWPPGFGPGTEMFEMLKDIGVTDKPNCTCKATANQMDMWGVEGCRNPQNFQWILNQVNANAANWKWTEYLAIAAANVLNPSSWKFAWSIDPLNIHKSLIETAINLAEKKQCDGSCSSGVCKRGCQQ